jgi:hypothetical protein
LTKWAKKSLADVEVSWAGVEPSEDQALMTASKGRSIAIGFFHGLANGKDLEGTPVKILALVRMAGGDGSQLYAKPSNCFMFGFKQGNGKVYTPVGLGTHNSHYKLEIRTNQFQYKIPPYLFVCYDYNISKDVTVEHVSRTMGIVP